MTSRDEQRRKRRSDSFRRDEADEADNWLAGLRGSGRGEPDPFAAPPADPGSFDRSGSFDRPGPPERSGSFDRPGPLERSGSFDRPGPLERPGSFDRGAPDRPGPPSVERPGSFDRGAPERPGPPSVERPGSFDRGAPDRPGAPSTDRSGSFERPPLDRGDAADRTTAIQRPRRGDGTGESRGGRRGRDDSPSGVFGPSGLPPAPPPGRPNLDAPAGRRRAADDSPSGSFGRPGDAPGGGFGAPANGGYGRNGDDSPGGALDRTAPPAARSGADAQPPAEPRGRRRAREDGERRPSESYDHGPELTPIIKPLGDFAPTAGSADPPPLVPIFPNMRPDASPTSGAGRRARRAAEETPAAFTGDAAGGGRRRREDSTGDTASRTGDLGRRTGDADPRTGELGSRTGDLGSRAGERTGDLGSRSGDRAGDLGRRPGDIDPRSRDIDPRTGDIDPRTGDFDPRTGESRLGQFGSPPGGGRRRAPEDEPAIRTGDGFGAEPGAPANGRAPYAGETTMFRRGEDTGPRRGSAFDDDPRRGPNGFDGPRGYDDGPRGYDDTGRRSRAAFESAAPATEAGRRDDSGVRRREEAMRRRPALDEPPQQRRAPDDAMAYDPYDEPSGSRRRGTGEYTGEYTSGGSRRALREPPGGRPSGPPGRPDRSRPGTPQRAVVDPVRPGPRPHRWVALLSAIAVLVVLGACAMGTWFIFKDEKNGPDSAKSSATTGPKRRDISSRDVDPKPLTEAEVFPNNNIVAVPDEPPYVIMATKASPDCKVAATEELATLLAGAGCSEVVRATMKSPNQEYLITAGVFNVTSEKVAAQTFDSIKPIVDGQKGRFAGMSVGVGTGTDALVRAPTQLGWNYKGHFITYCVIARVDGQNFAQGDPYPNQITYDIVETYLDNGIIENRAVIQPEATPAASLPASAPPS
ncbi:hypothetical protein [Dactylosporangium salmoneum]